MYNSVIFLYSFNDLSGALATTFFFCLFTFLGSYVSSRFLPDIWYGLGVVIGSFVGWCIAYKRVRWMAKHIDVHIFCNGNILKRGKGARPSSKVFDRYAEEQEEFEETEEDMAMELPEEAETPGAAEAPEEAVVPEETETADEKKASV